MTTFSSTHPVTIRQSRTAQELPSKLRDVSDLHAVSYKLILSSLLITIALMTLAWLVTASSTEKIRLLDPMNGLAVRIAS